MLITSTREEQISLAGLTYGRRHDFTYRTGLILQTLGAALLAVLYAVGNPFYTTGIMLFEVGVLLSAIYLLVWIGMVKQVIVGSVMIGLALQVAGSFFVPEHQAGTVIIIGIGFVCAGAAGMVGKEAYCFGYPEGWLLAILGFPGIIIANLLGRESRQFNTVGFSIIALLLLSLTGKKLRQKLISPCTKNACGIPGKDVQS